MIPNRHSTFPFSLASILPTSYKLVYTRFVFVLIKWVFESFIFEIKKNDS